MNSFLKKQLQWVIFSGLLKTLLEALRGVSWRHFSTAFLLPDGEFCFLSCCADLLQKHCEGLRVSKLDKLAP